jgi:hypothetical protein
MNWACGRRLKPTAKLVLMSLADATDDQGVCWPSVPTLARKCCTSTRTVQRILGELVEAGLLRAEPRFRKDRSRSSNRYCLALEGGDNLSGAPDMGDRGPLTPVTGLRDGGVTPRTTNRTAIESPLPPNAGSPLQASGTQAAAGGGGDWNQLEYPNGFLDQERRLANRLLAEFPTAIAQQLLDELAGRMAGDTIRSAPLAYLRGLARRAKVGDFTPELALRVAGARKRRRQVEAALHRAEAACEKDLAANATNKDDPLERRLATLRSRLRGSEGNGG